MRPGDWYTPPRPAVRPPRRDPLHVALDALAVAVLWGGFYALAPRIADALVEWAGRI